MGLMTAHAAQAHYYHTCGSAVFHKPGDSDSAQGNVAQCCFYTLVERSGRHPGYSISGRAAQQRACWRHRWPGDRAWEPRWLWTYARGHIDMDTPPNERRRAVRARRIIAEVRVRPTASGAYRSAPTSAASR